MTEQQDSSQWAEKGSFASATREIRFVPLSWEHPKDETGAYKPLMSRDMAYTEEEIEEGLADGRISSREELDTWFMPDFSNVPEEEMGICAYESTTEGTPISPVRSNNPQGRFEIARYCAENNSVFVTQRGDIETWAAILYSNNTALVDLQNGRVEISDFQENPSS
ncbi:MAG: hypothetical protein Q7T54_03410 [Candidatus Levybacteria bacterium]|nr:hypothetical protein [Candidatus Levybacteria bacterium]